MQTMVDKFLSEIFVRNETDAGCLERFRQTSLHKGRLRPCTPPFPTLEDQLDLRNYKATIFPT